ncbi:MULTISPECIES: hypothetical protein [Gordonibacter]|uniref:ABC transporter permease n=1 Tax=Gordonibacter faecis TaxID=3047475 RepID=A0ABT7DQ05_9ACTN|nr:hypothetical protein [Gordonibacter sp. KGMB12511]MDJ1651302.1 hypothetical protein [Gordonibacter sp. KGMB12511]HIW76292.1 hypothetical protein [Candidatus Gordonibacter avicola]
MTSTPHATRPIPTARLLVGSARRTASFARDHLLALVLCIALLVAAAFITQRLQASYLQHNGFNPTFADSLIWLLGPANATPFPLLWCVCPVVAMTWLLFMERGRDEANWAVRHGSFRRLWATRLVETTLVSLTFGFIAFAAATAASLIGTAAGSTPLVNFDDPHSLFAAFCDGTTTRPPSLATLLATALCLSLLAPCVLITLHALLRWILPGEVLAFLLITAAGLTAVHSPLAFALDAARALGTNLTLTNPLALLYETSSIAHATWLPGATHHLWLMPAVWLAAATLGLATAHRKELPPKKN